MRSTKLGARFAALAAALALACGMAAPAFAAAAPTASQTVSRRGDVVRVTPIDHLTAAQATRYARENGFAVPDGRDGVDAYRIVYRTVTPQGRATTASGVLALPHDAGDRALPTVEYTHGTMPYRGDAPSVSNGPDRAVPVMFAAQGFAGVAPDYLGLGVGPGAHPYMDVASETTASVDLLRAARTVAARHGERLDGRLYATGFSQGGAAAMGVARAAQRGDAPGFRLAGLAPVSGPYDLSGQELPAAFDGRLAPPTAAFYLAYVLTAWNRLHPLYHSPSEAFRAPYDKTLAPLFDGDHTDQQIVAALAPNPQALLTPKFLALLQHPTGAFAAMLRTADAVCTDWTPRVPVRLYAADRDTDVAFGNAVSCDRSLRAHGVDAPLVNVGHVDHPHSAYRAYPQILRWFETLAGQR
ncbi:alpha/beta hydrolase family protein [Streptacidiphilus jiangxiensis]|uniref:Secretory lipase n=1 Tax=Streptacidiphilus jiangxiensis TaxID=235985 RepID=A0A1H7J6D2_STRJI|nr:hypothetical protein [Streptacidiphilus jiangxiensis]SEK68685.1 hypothetical protein SAMN05414137_103115 [Streptacidiphilus jiangxiensis]